MIATFNFRSFVSYESIDDRNIHFSCFKELIDDCNIHFLIFFVLEELIDDCNIHFSFFLFSKKQLMTATFDFQSFVSYESIDDCNIQFGSVKQGRYWRYI